MQNQARHRQENLTQLQALISDMAERQAEEMLPKVVSEIPPGTPLTLSIARATEVFDTSERTLRKLIKVPGFPVVKLGSTAKILTYKAMKWFEANQGETIDLE